MADMKARTDGEHWSGPAHALVARIQAVVGDGRYGEWVMPGLNEIIAMQLCTPDPATTLASA